MDPKKSVYESESYEEQIASVMYQYEQIILDTRKNPDTQRILSFKLQNFYHQEYFDNYIRNMFKEFTVTSYMTKDFQSPSYRLCFYIYPKGIHLTGSF